MQENASVSEALKARERVARLNEELRRARILGVMTPDSASLNFRQILNTVQEQILRSDVEIARLQSEIDQWRGQKRQAARIADLIINQIASYNRIAESAAEEEREMAIREGGDDSDGAANDEPEAKEPPKRARRRSTKSAKKG